MRYCGSQNVRHAAVLCMGIAAWTAAHTRILAAPPTPTPTARTFTAPGIAQCAWIAGSWLGEHDGGILEEHWTAPAGGTMSGMARLVIGDKTIFHEYLRIVAAPDGGAEYQAQPRGRCPVESFRLTRATATEAVFENPANENPSLIRYTLDDGGRTLVVVTVGIEKGERIIHESRLERGSITGAARGG